MSVETATAFFADGPIMHAFETGGNNTGIHHGVNVQGTRCGVYGESVLTDRTTSRESMVENVGVHGEGDNIGVFGNGNTAIFGVVGIHNGLVRKFSDPSVKDHQLPGGGDRDGNDAAAVLGAAMRDATGVVGLSLDAIGNPLALTIDSSGGSPADGSGTGVLGASGDGTGVHGIATDGVGVLGTSESKDGVSGASVTGTGVSGSSDRGIGVRASSRGNRGGQFESGKNVAQLRLVPQRQKSPIPQLPKKGQVGDLILIRNTAVRGDVRMDVCSLWLCVPKKPGSDDSDQWQQVVLGPVVTGTV
jgi:hypothetical protein